MAKKLVREKLWEVAECLLLPEPDKTDGGRSRIDQGAALIGIPLEMLPQEMGCGSGMTLLAYWHGLLKQSSWEHWLK